MTQALQRASSLFPAEKEQAIVLVGPKEKQSPLIIFADYQKNRFSDYFVRLRKIAENETPIQCFHKHFSPEELTEYSYVVICNGVQDTTEQLARDFFSKLNIPLPACTDYAKRRREASFPDGYYMVQFLSYALRTPLWTPFYDHTVPVKSLYDQYCNFMKDTTPAKISCFSRTLHILLPTATHTRFNGRAHYRIPRKQSCLEQLAMTTYAIRNKPLSSVTPLPLRLSNGLSDCEKTIAPKSPIVTKKQKFAPYLASTKEGSRIAQYSAYCLTSGEWSDFYSKRILTVYLYKHYCKTTVKMQTERHSIGDPIAQRVFTKMIHALFDNITTTERRFQQFPSEKEALAQWEKVQAALAKLTPSRDTVERFVTANVGSFKGTTSVTKLYDRYKKWCSENSCPNNKEITHFKTKLHTVISCKVEGDTVQFDDIFD